MFINVLKLTWLSWAVVFTSTLCIAQNKHNAELHEYLNQAAYLLKEGGQWKAENKDYNAAEAWSPRYFGYTFKQGLNPNTLLIRISGYLPQKAEWVVYWDGFYTWDYAKQKAIYQSVNPEGALARGESETIKENELTLVFTITSPDGKIEKHKDVERFVNGQIVSSSFKYQNNKWANNNSMTWTRLEQPRGTLSFLTTRDGNFEIYSMDADGNNLKNLTCNKALDFGSSWSPDGKYILFYSDRDGRKNIYRMDADGKNPVRITKDSGQHFLPEWSPDGEKIVYVAEQGGKSRDLYIMNKDGSGVLQLTNNDLYEESPSFSPDGKKIVFTRQLREPDDTAHAANGEIFIMNADGSDAKRLTNKKGYDSGPRFSPDGSKIAFYGPDEKGNFELFIMNADGTGMINLTQDPLEDYSPEWSPDGNWIAYSRGTSANYDAWAIHIETGIKFRLTTNPKRDESPVWKPVN